MPDFEPGDFVGTLRALANELRPPGDEMHDDLIQEGSIAMWRAHQKFDPARGGYRQHMRMVAKKRMMDIASQRKKPLRPVEQINKASAEPKRAMLSSLDARLDPDDDRGGEHALAEIPEMVVADVFDQVAAAYHHGEIAAALGQLTEEQRRYVVLRFWGGLEPRNERAPLNRRGTEYLGYREREATRQALADVDDSLWPEARAHLARLLAGLS